ncbi:prephenate dehydrogenase [Desulforamulus ferrireducens]|uniref:Prephenate dehydrogenase n=1 Tax=Desulforamulus ferrireducens TaxID=1833852 RepID=A0A1S6IUZ7_9FIRM|nr:prephenate dehydrogenase/arogenate dehydrogenase family protein [Desulforamulus ferrireducens]AQS58589.1 prephenate dehydrogenase [Desulforamulus ferrireducens]
MLFKKVVIAGVGLIGGSLGLALCKRNIVPQVVGVDPDQDNLELAVQLGAVHQGATLAEALTGADLFIIATPIGVSLGVLEMALPYLQQGTIVTDVGSVKGRLVERAEAMLPAGIHFIGGHPMAGLEVAGVSGAREDLFEGACYLLTPTEKTEPAALIRLRGLIECLGATPMELDYREHDEAVAVISHLPHLLSAALVNTVSYDAKEQLLLTLAAGGFRDTTRIAASNPLMWRDILLTNRSMVLAAINKFRVQLDKIEQSIEQFDPDILVDALTRAQNLRSTLPENRKYRLRDK